jgi:hypothetical protein
MNSQSVVDQMTSALAERRQLARDRRTAYLALARAILSEGAVEQLSLYAVGSYQPLSLSERHVAAA